MNARLYFFCYYNYVAKLHLQNVYTKDSARALFLITG